ncbi:hypothetical protein CHS0354_013447 [Potamilus streckersoni]|uniref:Potassium channel domain-containing protein n=1 Tax=Potamilus streckersoni TaxID=2493646 RepID=A0AAE0RYR9_9BIVA|nr:hypothetical protein CHS0354_013447 [Potamilus streckersoni]
MSETFNSARRQDENRKMCLNVKTLCVKFSLLLKKFFTLFFSYFGLMITVILCMSAGASIFEFLEKDNEVQECFDTFKDYHKMENMTLESLKTVIYSSKPESEGLMPQVVGILETFRDNIFYIKYDGRDCAMYGRPEGPQYKWSWLGSFLFVVTIVTSIGYGHIAPKTVWGRIICIAYAMIGIPLTMIFLASIGNTLATMVRFMYGQLIHCGCCKWIMKKSSKNKLIHIQSNRVVPESTSQTGLVPNIQIAKPTEIIRYRIRTRERDMVDEKLYISTIQTSVDVRESRNIDSVSNLYESKQTQVKAHFDPQNIKRMIQDTQQTNTIVQQQQSLIADDNESNGDKNDIEEEPRQSVPLTVAIIIMISYIVIGAVIFGIWRNWDILQGSYFCFISLSTIGFGDLVPGTDFTLPSAHTELIFGSIYIIFGLALISMCFALMQEEFVEKMNWIGRKFGVV